MLNWLLNWDRTCFPWLKACKTASKSQTSCSKGFLREKKNKQKPAATSLCSLQKLWKLGSNREQQHHKDPLHQEKRFQLSPLESPKQGPRTLTGTYTGSVGLQHVSVNRVWALRRSGTETSVHLAQYSNLVQLENLLLLIVTTGFSVKNNDIICFNCNRSLLNRNLLISGECQLRLASQHLDRWDPCFAHTGKQDKDFRTKQCKRECIPSYPQLMHTGKRILSFSAGRRVQKEKALQGYFIQWGSCLPAEHLVLCSTVSSATVHRHSFHSTGTEQSDCATGILLLTRCYYKTALLQPRGPCLNQHYTVWKKIHSTGRVYCLIEKGDFIQSTVEKYKATWRVSSWHGGYFLTQDTISTSSGALIQVKESLEQFPIRCTSIHNTKKPLIF